MKQLLAFYIITIASFSSFLSSCKKFIEVANPTDQVVSSQLFSSDAGAVSAVSGLYSNMMTSGYFFANGGITIPAGLSADELYSRLSSLDEVRFYQNALLSTDEFIVNTRLWGAAYRNIYQANAIIEALNKSASISPSVKSQILGEAKLIRAFHYFYLVNLFGKVPLITATAYQTNSTVARTEAAEVYQQIVADLKDAESQITDSYVSPQRVRPNKWTATALLSRVYLYLQQWKNAEDAATAVITSGQYSLVTNLDSVFLPSSDEIIWQLLPVAGSKTPTEAQAFLPAASASAKPLYPLTPSAAASFETGDLRSVHWLQTKKVSGVDFAYPFKYKTKTVSAEPVEYNVVFRLAEQYLIRAEARIQLGNYDGAQSDLNIIRSRAGLPSTTAATKSDLLTVLEKENRSEYFAEWGHRWFDLKRWGKADAVLGTIKAPNWQSSDTLYPIPLTEMKRNPALSQNPGY